MSSEALRRPSQLRLIFLGTMLLLAGMLGWLGWRLLEQDRQLADQRLADRKETTADLVVAALEKRLAAIEQQLAETAAAGTPPAQPGIAEGAVMVQFAEGSIHAWPRGRLLYYPDLPTTAEPPDEVFAAADELEFRKHDYAGAIQLLRSIARSADVRVQAAAEVRIARNDLNNHQFAEALRSYRQVAGYGAIPLGGMPAALAGGIGAIAVLERRGDRLAVTEAALELQRDLRSGRWLITSAAYHYVDGEISRWTADGKNDAPPPRLALSEAVERLWELWSERHVQMPGRATWLTSAGPVLVVWRAAESTHTAFVVCGPVIEKQWATVSGALVVLTDPDGHFIGDASRLPATRPAIRLASVTQLPWNVQVFEVPDSAEDTAYRLRRSLLIAATAILLAMIGGGGWFIGHSVARELALARLQTDFVSAISHEFRTPLTTLFQLSELLKRGRVASEQDRQEYYELLHRESDRLRRLVESLLSFGRLEAGRMQFRFETLDAASLVRQLAVEFAQGQQACGHKVDVEGCVAVSQVKADREAIRCVVWNLLENAAKYSPDSDALEVEVSTGGRNVEIAVRDHGIGIPRSEQRRIFEKFVRGAAARERNIRGTGIGLAMARQIVRAHGGEITVESEPGKGSTFRVMLPVKQT
jgi:signal transduction histidine kinase